MTEPLAPLDPMLAKLLDVERAPHPPPADGKERVRARLTRTLLVPPGGGGGGGGGATATPNPTASVLGRTAATFIIGAVAGGALLHLTREPRVVYVDRVLAVSATTTTAATSATIATTALEPPAVSAPPSARITPTPSTTPDKSGGSLAAERALLEPARAALARGDAIAALDAIARHEKAFPSGALTEEREALAIQTLAAAHRGDEARTRAQRFKTRWPQSVFLPVIDATLGPGK
jgi:hypothetical protein